MKMTLSHRYLDANLDVLQRLGFPKDDALTALDLSDAFTDTPTTRFPVETFLSFLKDVAVQLDDPFVALRMGHRFRIATFARTGSVYGYCRNLKQVIELNARYQCLAIDVGRISYEQTDGRHIMRFRPYYDDQQDYQMITDLVMGAYGTAYRWLSWASGEELGGVALPYPKPGGIDLYEKIFQSAVSFADPSGSASLTFSEAAMSQQLTTYDEEKLTRAQMQLDRLLDSESASASLDAALEAAIRGAIRTGRINTHIVADRMGRGWPNLKAELSGSGPSFRDRVDNVRREMFLDLHARGYNLAEIAQALAYNDQPAFNRAFKRWYGMSPTQWFAQQAD